MSRAEIIALQTKVGVKADGIMGPKTRAAVKAWESKNKIAGTRSTVLPIPIPAFKPSVSKKAAIVSLQKKLGVKADGVIGPKTKKAMAKASGKAPTISAKLMAGEVPGADSLAGAVAEMPVSARVVAASQLNQFSGGADDLDALVAGLANTIAPELSTIKDALAAKDVTSGATSESNALITEGDRWATSLAAQTKILEAIQNLALQVVAKDKVTRRYFQAYGVPIL